MGVSEPIVLSKTMSLSEDEFAQSLSIFLGRPWGAGERSVTIAVGAGRAEISYAELPGMRLGGLLELPRASVTLTFDGVSAYEREAFIKRFEIAFQRGGG